MLIHSRPMFWLLFCFGCWINRGVMAESMLSAGRWLLPHVPLISFLFAPALVLPLLIPLAFVGARSRKALCHVLAPFVRAYSLLVCVHLWVLILALEYYAVGSYLGGHKLFSAWLGVPASLVLLIPTIMLPRAVCALFRSEELEPVYLGPARAFPRSAHSRVWRLVEQCAGVAGVRPPDDVLVCLEPVFCVTEAPVIHGESLTRGRTLIISLSLLHFLSTDELRAIICHEMSHLRTGDLDLHRRLHRTLSRVGSLAYSFDQIRNLLWRQPIPFIPGVFYSAVAILALPSMMCLNFAFTAFAIAERVQSRGLEFAADFAGSRGVGPLAMARALVKVHAYGAAWVGVEEALATSGRALGAGGGVNVAELFVTMTEQGGGRLNELDAILDDEQVHPLDSHPTLRDRLLALLGESGFGFADLMQNDTSGDAIALVPEFRKIEMDLSQERFWQVTRQRQHL